MEFTLCVVLFDVSDDVVDAPLDVEALFWAESPFDVDAPPSFVGFEGL